MPRLYMADLAGAGLGVLIAMLMMNSIGTPATTFLIAAPVLLGALIESRRWLKIVPVGIAAGMIVLSFSAEKLLEKPREEPLPVVYRHWDAMAKIKLYEPKGNFQRLNIDNVAHTGTMEFDGNWDRPDSMKFEFSINMQTLVQQFDSCRYLIIGAGGGGDVIQPLQMNVPEIHAVEVIPHINDLLVNGRLAEFSGYIYRDPRVKVVTEDARAYARRFQNKFDIIYSSSSNTFTALSSGAFAMAENYIFTTEAFRDYWRAMTDNGFMVLEHQVYMPRIVSAVRNALNSLGVPDINSHFAVYDWPTARRNLLLLSKRPLTDDIIDHAITGEGTVAESPFKLLYPAPDSARDNLVNRIVMNGWEQEADSAQIDISPTTDNRPFIAQMGMWKNLQWSKMEKVIPYSDVFGFPLSKLIIVIILLVVLFLIVPLNLLPYLFKGRKLKAAPWLYFFLIGMAFMIVEIVLMQKYTLFIGPSVYSVITILISLLIGSGIGSRFSERFGVAFAFGGIILWILLDIFIFKQITIALSGLTVLPRALITALLIFPLGFFMGMPFPKGALKVGELIDWGFAVNGTASVFGSTLIVLFAFAWGFNMALLLGAVFYMLAFGLISLKTAW
jgi:spermidine synthase